MVTIHPLKTLPDNFACFMDEVSAGLTPLYGEAAAREYRQKALLVMAANLLHPAASAFVALKDGIPAGMCTGHIREKVAQFNFIHVLNPYIGMGIEHALVEHMVRHFRAKGAKGIVCDTVPLCAIPLKEVFIPMGFSHVARQLMGSAIGPNLLNRNEPVRSCPVQEEEWAEVAACVVEAYRGEPGRHIHQEVQDMVSAIDFVSRVSSGAFGPCPAECLRAIWQETECNGAVLGSRIAEGAGFVLQLVVRPEVRRQGLATALLTELAGSFHAAGCTKIVLGVTLDNPALQLYERLGFKILRPVDTFFWWRADKA